MKTTEYILIREQKGKLQELEAGKHDDHELPEFSKEIPIATTLNEANDSIIMEHEWRASATPTIKIKRIEFRKGMDLIELCKVGARDGSDSITLVYNGITYIMRKSLENIAQAIYNSHGKIKGALEDIVAFIKTTLGNFYIVSKVGKQVWSFDRRIAKADIHYIETDKLDRKARSRLFEMIVEGISELHSSNLVISRFSLANILLDDQGVKFTDLRNLRVSRKRMFVVDEFIGTLQYLFTIGIATKADIYHATAHYASHNEQSAQEWYQTKTNRKASNLFDLTLKMEKEVCN